MPSKKRTRYKIRAQSQWLGKPVLVVLKDGSYVVGMMGSLDKEKVTLSGWRPEKKLPVSIIESRDKAQISGFFSSLFGFNNAPDAEGTVGGSTRPNLFQFFGQIIPHIQVGMKVVKSIMPLMALFKA